MTPEEEVVKTEAVVELLREVVVDFVVARLMPTVIEPAQLMQWWP